MTWKAIGQSVIGSSHIASGKPCEDALQYCVVKDLNNEEVLICCASDGAGSARFAAEASAIATRLAIEELAARASYEVAIEEADIYAIAENIYDRLQLESVSQNVPLNEFSCTLLGCYITSNKAVFFHIGDGAIVRNDGSGYYIPVWWPHNGEYQNSTSFIIDDASFGNLNIIILAETINEVAIFSDGLQMLALNMEGCNVHQPFFTDLFKYLRMADSTERLGVLNRKLEEYLNGRVINERTDDDKTLFLATRLPV